MDRVSQKEKRKRGKRGELLYQTKRENLEFQEQLGERGRPGRNGEEISLGVGGWGGGGGPSNTVGSWVPGRNGQHLSDF